MQIGTDFPKIEFEWFGLELLEPNAFIGDFILFLYSVYAIYRVLGLKKESEFHRSWVLFFVFFGASFLLGGFGHLLYNYWGVPGKTPSWFLSIIATFYIEKAMISLLQLEVKRKKLLTISKIKLMLALVGMLLLMISIDLEKDYSKAIIVPTINSTIGLFYALGVIAYSLSKKFTGMSPFIISVFTLFPAAVFQMLKINIHPWMDKNDVTHLLLLLALWLYLIGIKNTTERNSNV